MAKLFLVFIAVFFQIGPAFSQMVGADTFALKGNWTVCVILDFSKDFNCDKGYVTYQFFDNGTFKDSRPSIDGGGEHPYSSGRWTLRDNLLIIDYDDTDFSKSPPVSYRITFLTYSKFYSVGREGQNGATTYTYFQKVD